VFEGYAIITLNSMGIIKILSWEKVCESQKHQILMTFRSKQTTVIAHDSLG
jgi:hypothetical protein